MAGLPRAARVLVVATVAVAVVVAGVALAAAPPRTASAWAAAVVLSAVVAVSEHFQFEIPYRRERLTYSVTDAVWTAAILLAEPGVVLVAVCLGVGVGQAVQAWAPVKVAFNVAQFVLGAAAALAVYGALGRPEATSPLGWLAVALAMAAFQVVSTLLTSAVITLVEGEPFWRTALDPSAPLHWLGNLALGILGAVLWLLHPVALPLLLVPLALAFVAYRGLLRSLEERDAMRQMARDADLISRGDGAAGRLQVPAGLDDARALADTLNRMLSRLDSSFQRERRFIREASHELRTPITICRGHLELLGPTPTAAEVAETSEIVIDELDRMARIVDDMNTLARLEDPATLRREPIAVSALLSRVGALAVPLGATRLQVRPVADDETVDVDPQRITQALINLVVNAVRHNPAGTTVELRSERRARTWRLSVTDDGRGLAAGEEALVFRPFTTGTSRAPGSGLGLAIVQGIAAAHGGSAGADNRPGGGATFWLEVPR